MSELVRYWLYYRHGRDPVGTAIRGTARSYLALPRERSALIERWQEELREAFGAESHVDLLRLLRQRHGAASLKAESSPQPPEESRR